MQNEKIEIIDISKKVHDIFYKITIQVNDPRKIDQKVLKDFIGENRTEKVTLIKGNHRYEGELLNTHPHSMNIKFLDKDFKIQRNDTILVLFNHPTYDQYFVIQAVVKKVYSSWIATECQDPRYDRRYNFRLKKRIEFFELPQMFYDLIRKRKVHIIREILHQTASKGEQVHRYIENIYSDINGESANLKHLSLEQLHFHPDYKSVLATLSLKGDIRDISRGGICILSDERLYNKINLLLINFNTPSIKDINSSLNCDQLHFNLLGSIRKFSTIGRKNSIHIQFLKRLEDDNLEDTFSKLEKYYLLINKPL